MISILVFVPTVHAQTQWQQRHTVTFSRNINYGYIDNQINLIQKFQSEAPKEYEETWKYIAYKLGLDEGVDFEDLEGLENREARIILVHAALAHFSNLENKK